MASTLVFSTLSIFVFLLLRVCSVHSKANVFDVTFFGNISGKTPDITEALLKAWRQACIINNSVVLIPKGTFLLNTVTLAGPCNGSTTFLLKGDLKAPINASSMNSREWVLFCNIHGLSIIGNGSFDGQGESAWLENECKRNLACKSLPTSINLKNVTNSLIQDIASIDSKFFHVVISRSESILIKNVKIHAPDYSHNTDGIHISRSKTIIIQNVDIGTGDDCISLSQGSTNIFINQVTCGPGHGISVGSLGMYGNEEDVSGIIVENCTLTNTTNGARIKTWAPSFPSRVFNLTFQDIILNNVRNPIIINQHYCPNFHCESEGESEVEISHVQFLNFRGTSADKVAATLNCSASEPCGDDIVLGGLDISYIGGGPTTAVCTNFHGIFFESKSPFACANEIAPSPRRGVEVAPSPSRGVAVAPSPSSGVAVAPSPSRGVAVAPSPSRGLETAQSPSGGVEVAQIPSGGVQVAPTRSGGVEA